MRRQVATALGVTSGACIAVQSRINGDLAQRLGDPVAAATISFGTGLLVIAAIVGLRPATRNGVRMLRAALASGGIRWWQCVGGASGAAFVAVQAQVVPVVGVALYSVAVVAGQTSSALGVDKVGLGPGGRAPVTRARVTAAVLATVAVVVAVSGSLGVSGDVLALLAALAAGAVLAVQQAVNGHVTRASGQAQVAGLVNFAVGTVLLLLALAVVVLVDPPGGDLPGEPWLYVGGLLGLVGIVAGAAVVRTLGVLTLGLCSVLGQLGGSLVVDLVAPVHGEGVTWRAVAGCALVACAVGVAARDPWKNPSP